MVLIFAFIIKNVGTEDKCIQVLEEHYQHFFKFKKSEYETRNRSYWGPLGIFMFESTTSNNGKSG